MEIKSEIGYKAKQKTYNRFIDFECCTEENFFFGDNQKKFFFFFCVYKKGDPLP